MTAPYSLRGPPPQPVAPMPYASKRSILDRVLGRLFPTAQYIGLAAPEDLHALQQQGLLNVGLNLLAQSGPHPMGQAPGLGQAIGQAIQGVDFPGMVQQAMAAQQMRKSMATQEHVQDVVQKAQSVQDPYARVSQIVTELAGIPGTEDLVGKLSNVLAQLKPPVPPRTRYTLHTEISDGSDPRFPRGMPIITRINMDDPTDKVAVGQAIPPAVPGAAAERGVAAQETRASARNALAALDEADALLARDPEADIMPTAAAIARGAETIPGIGGLLRGAAEPVAQKAMSANQKLFQQAMDQFLHNYSALLPRGGRSVQILRNLRSSFAPGPGQNEASVRAGFAQARRALRHTLEMLAAGDVPTDETTTNEAPAAPTSGSARARLRKYLP